ncbi:hypothetical protein ACI2K4_31450 [Micromonospora sp. NPDC050397]|uniref:hypothetical protein n=1 Tax=Micromonospora sp. NPDC050397 TaxID=3364279 RepID=UPI00384AF49C
MAGLDPKPGDALLIGGAANPEFRNGQILLRVIRAEATQLGRVWLYGYEINTRGTASRKRQVHAFRAGLRRAEIRMLRPELRKGHK